MAFLTRKLGPLPVWVWATLLVAVIAVVLVWRRSKGSSSAAPIQPAGPTQPAIEWTNPAVDPTPSVTTPVIPDRRTGAPPPLPQLPVGPALNGDRIPGRNHWPVGAGRGLQSNLNAPVQRPWRPA